MGASLISVKHQLQLNCHSSPPFCGPKITHLVGERWSASMPKKWAWVLMELPPLIIVAYLFLGIGLTSHKTHPSLVISFLCYAVPNLNSTPLAELKMGDSLSWVSVRLSVVPERARLDHALLIDGLMWLFAS